MYLIEAVIAVGIGATGLMFMAGGMANQMNASASSRLKNDKESIRIMVEAQTSCSKSMPAGCASGATTSLKKKNGEVIGPKIGSFTIKAECNATGDGLVVKAARIDPTDSTKFLKDPMTKAEMGWKRLSPADLCSSQDRDMVCQEASRKGNVVTGATGSVDMIGGSVNQWGLACKKPYFRSACSISTLPTTGTDVDLVLITNGCTSDDEEWAAQHTLFISCCKFKE